MWLCRTFCVLPRVTWRPPTMRRSAKQCSNTQVFFLRLLILFENNLCSLVFQRRPNPSRGGCAPQSASCKDSSLLHTTISPLCTSTRCTPFWCTGMRGKKSFVMHSSLICSGSPDLGGHYWSYIRDHKSNSWFKFNDVAVNRVEQIDVSASTDIVTILGLNSIWFLGNVQTKLWRNRWQYLCVSSSFFVLVWFCVL